MKQNLKKDFSPPFGKTRVLKELGMTSGMVQ
jgi:hypothetical protein